MLLDDLLADKKKVEKELKHRTKEVAKMRKERNDAEQDKNEIAAEVNSLNIEYDSFKSRANQGKKDIESFMRERDLLNTDVVKGEDQARAKYAKHEMLKNQFKKLKNKNQGYKTETDKLGQVIKQLEDDKTKYGLEASHANSKYYQCLEKVKLKSNLITKLQKKNIEADAKLKQQQNLYEVVRSDRNLYSKNLREVQEEISDLKMKYKRMTQQISQLKDEIGLKDAAIHKQNMDKATYQQENNKINSEIGQKKREIASYDMTIKTQEEDIGRLKYVISEAEAEKQKQRKDYEMVINERDILGTQLIKRNEELSLLYEKIKIQQSTLTKGDIYYNEKYVEIQNFKDQIAKLKREIIVSKHEVDVVPQMKNEIYMIEKELMDHRLKAKTLSEELEKPMNVHRWRELEVTEPEVYEMILKIQSLQKRLIAKSEEVGEKDILIQEKEKLYVELKNILAKQSGPEVAEKLKTYQQNLKERTKQLREMAGELKSYQSQVNAYQFEIERIDKEIVGTKKQWFAMQRQNVEVIPEVDEGGDEEMGQEQPPHEIEMEGDLPGEPAIEEEAPGPIDPMEGEME